MRRSLAYLVVVLAAGVPRLVVLLREREAILEELADRSDRFATTLVDHRTFGFLPDVPSAYIDPLYGWFLAGLYFPFGRSWLAVGLVQIVLAVATAVVVLEIGRRLGSTNVGVVAALLTTLHPYVVWHDVHANREILDGFLLAVLVWCALVAYERGTTGTAALTGAVAGLAVLSNTRLVLLPLVVGVYVAWQVAGGLRVLLTIGIVCFFAALVVAPWVARNEMEVGCYALTTDTRALWKANNLNTRTTLDDGGWLDDVPEFPGAPPSPELAADLTLAGQPTRVDECAQMRLYRDRVLDFWREHQEEKVRLAVQATRMLWNPFPHETDSSVSSSVRSIRRTVEPGFVILLYAMAIAGLFVAPGRFVALALALLAYNTLAAMAFAGTTRYRVPWDFLLALLGAFALAAIWGRYVEPRRGRRRGLSLPTPS